MEDLLKGSMHWHVFKILGSVTSLIWLKVIVLFSFAKFKLNNKRNHFNPLLSTEKFYIKKRTKYLTTKISLSKVDLESLT